MGQAVAQLRVGLIVPLQGPAGIFGPSCEAVAATALRAINDTGVLGRELAVEVIDGGAPPTRIAEEVARLLDAGCIDAVTGWHISAVREAVAPVTAGRIPYVYTSLYEGGEARPGVFCSGETPARQIAPALRWLRDSCGIRSWFIVGDDYIWPRASVDVTKSFARQLGLQAWAFDFTGGPFGCWIDIEETGQHTAPSPYELLRTDNTRRDGADGEAGSTFDEYDDE